MTGFNMPPGAEVWQIPGNDREDGRYVVQVQAEWSGMPDAIDEDFHVGTWEDVERVVREEVPSGCIYQVFEGDVLVEEETKP